MDFSRDSRRPARPQGSWFARAIRFLFRLVMLALVLVLVALVAGWWWLRRVPADYPEVSTPIPAPAPGARLGGGLDAFDSPYLGHTGSWNGHGGTLTGSSKTADLDREVALGLRWTFMPVYWRAMEPEGPVNLGVHVPPEWLELDAFVEAAHERRLNILFQAPVVGGNAGGPPTWAGRREEGKSAPANMNAAADFAGKLAARYCPGGTLAQLRGWKDGYGVRAWELDNEPESYFTSWKGQAGDYAEFVHLVAQRIRIADAKAVIVGPALASGPDGLDWLAAALHGTTNVASPAFRASAQRHGIGRWFDVVSFHNYEGLDSAFGGGERTLAPVLQSLRRVFEQGETNTPGFSYERKHDYWHTEGNFDFFGILPAKQRAAWRIQFFTRAFAAGLRKVCVMDVASSEIPPLRAYVDLLPQPWPMLPALAELRVLRGSVRAYRHPEGVAADAGQIWVIWALAGTGGATVEVPVRRSEAEIIRLDGQRSREVAEEGRVLIHLAGDDRMAPPVLLIDRSNR